MHVLPVQNYVHMQTFLRLHFTCGLGSLTELHTCCERKPLAGERFSRRGQLLAALERSFPLMLGVLGGALGVLGNRPGKGRVQRESWGQDRPGGSRRDEEMRLLSH